MLNSLDPFLWEFDRLTSRAFDSAPSALMPMDILRRGEEILVTFDLPGVGAENFEITVDKGTLVVTATRAAEPTEGETYVVRERPAGTFTRRVRLGEWVDRDHIEASYDAGVLTVRIPLAEQAKPKKIDVQFTGSGKTAINA